MSGTIRENQGRSGNILYRPKNLFSCQIKEFFLLNFSVSPINGCTRFMAVLII